ncbi:MAG: hypothetical protein JWM60_417, partial [Solirubrobacterales bacterium]|nr:hypothetical protein [Solirubrobacterales bacterium]
AESMWSFLQGHKTAGLPWVSPTARVMHGLLVAAVGALALVLFWAKRRQTRVGLAAASAALLLAIEMCLSYYAFSYVLWFAPLVLIAALGKPGQLPNGASSSETEAARTSLNSATRRRDPGPVVATAGRRSRSSPSG